MRKLKLLLGALFVGAALLMLAPSTPSQALGDPCDECGAWCDKHYSDYFNRCLSGGSDCGWTTVCG